jgi:putative transposase
MRFAFIAKHRSIWPVAWLCEALEVSRSGFHAWLKRGPSARDKLDEKVTISIRASFVASARTYGARRVWRDVLAEGFSCGLHKIERLMQQNALRARPRRRGLPKDDGQRLANADGGYPGHSSRLALSPIPTPDCKTRRRRDSGWPWPGSAR